MWFINLNSFTNYVNKDSWIKTVTSHKKKCEAISSLSKKIRYVGVFNEYGRTISGKIMPGVKPIFSPNAVREEFFCHRIHNEIKREIFKSIRWRGIYFNKS